MVKIDLITGFLGSGKTTFIKKYAKYLIDQVKRRREKDNISVILIKAY